MKRFLAFSLIELMISLITISCITAAFTPVITKRLTHSSVSTAFSEVSIKCLKFGENCQLCDSKKCFICLKNCGLNQYKDNSTCSCKECSSYSPNCVECNSEKCTKCSAEYGMQGGECKKCPAGFFSDNSSDCKPCPVGYYQNEEGKTLCKPCPAGYFQNQEGKAYCNPCGTGSFQNETGKSVCKPCGVGKFQNEEGKTSCKNCLAGSFQNETGKSICKPCLVGNFQDAEGKTECKPCNAGTYQDEQGKSSCKNCLTGKWSTSGASSCDITCSVEYSCKNGVKNCAQGYYGALCQACNAGTYSNTTGSSSCTDCEAGTYSSIAKASCEPCPSGKYSNAKASACDSCSSFVSKCKTCGYNKGKVVCNDCEDGYKPNDAGDACEKNAFDCSGPNLLQAGNLCVTKRVNELNSSIFTIPDTVSTDSGCDPETGKCCRQSICNWEANNEICSKTNYGGKTWRLPTKEEMAILYIDDAFNARIHIDNNVWYDKAGGRCHQKTISADRITWECSCCFEKKSFGSLFCVTEMTTGSTTPFK